MKHSTSLPDPHFEKIFFGDELMNPNDLLDARFSRMSLAVAKDSGWYDIDLDQGEVYFWGKNEGCGIFDETCKEDKASEFCEKLDQTACDDSHTYITKCSNVFYKHQCQIDLNIKSCKRNHEFEKPYYHGPEAKCLTTKVLTRSCCDDRLRVLRRTQASATKSNAVMTRPATKCWSKPIRVMKS